MASEVIIELTYQQSSAFLTLLDPIGPDNTWSCNPKDFLATSSGKWVQGLGSQPVILSNNSGSIVLTIISLNMFNAKVGQSGNDANSSADGGIVGDNQSCDWTIRTVK